MNGKGSMCDSGKKQQQKSTVLVPFMSVGVKTFLLLLCMCGNSVTNSLLDFPFNMPLTNSFD